MPELLGKISRYNNTGFEVVVEDVKGELTRIRCSSHLWEIVHKNHTIGDIVHVEYTLIGEDQIKVARSFVKRNDLKGLFT